MKVNEIAEKLSLKVACGAKNRDRDVKGGYVSDLMSDVMAHAKKGDIWVTIQTHQNIVAVSTLVDIAAVVISGGRQLDDDAQKKAEAEGLPVLMADQTAFEIVCRLHELGVSGAR